MHSNIAASIPQPASQRRERGVVTGLDINGGFFLLTASVARPPGLGCYEMQDPPVQARRHYPSRFSL